MDRKVGRLSASTRCEKLQDQTLGEERTTYPFYRPCGFKKTTSKSQLQQCPFVNRVEQTLFAILVQSCKYLKRFLAESMDKDCVAVPKKLDRECHDIARNKTMFAYKEITKITKLQSWDSARLRTLTYNWKSKRRDHQANRSMQNECKKYKIPRTR